MSSGDLGTDLVLNGVGATARVVLDEGDEDGAMVALRLRYSRYQEPAWVAISPDDADELAKRLRRVAREAREARARS